jgi:NAD(P)-dependent dehydrogenase (short-subunit alcohol dehydrogenase family)
MTGRRVLVVGGGANLGAAIAGRLADEGDEVVVAGRTRATDPRVRSSHVIDATAVDWLALYRRVEAELGAPLDAVVFVAGAAVFGRTALVPPDRARRSFELNFWACTGAATDAARYWTGLRRPGAYVAVLSIVARRAVPFEAHYSAGKAAAARFLECLQLEHEPDGLRFVSAFPGMLKTPFRRTAEWFGLAPAATDEGADVADTARAVVGLLRGKRGARVIGWRERTIDLADRVAPGLYDRVVLRRRVRRALPGHGPG